MLEGFKAEENSRARRPNSSKGKEIDVEKTGKKLKLESEER